MRKEVIKAIEKNKIIVIVRGASVSQAVRCAKAVYDGGLRLIEVTFNQKNSDTFKDTCSAISQIKRELPNMIVGAGTVLTVEQVQMAKDAGAEYIVSPDSDEEVIKKTVELDMVSLPGAYTASEVKRAHLAGADFVKIFPCTDLQYFKGLKAPLSHIKMLAVGGVNLQNTADFIKAGASGVGIGSALVNQKYLDSEDYQKITEIAKGLVESVNAI